MEKTCEFCGAPQPVVYCQADAAVLCLSCDSKVHSANALFSRHSRTLLCDSCKRNPAYVRCLDHAMLVCQQCDSRMHKNLSYHKKLMINSFSGCPSAQHFATLWGIDVNELDQVYAVESSTSVLSMEPDIGFCSQHYKKHSNEIKKQSNSLIMNQILDLKNLQLTEGANPIKPSHHEGEYVTSSSEMLEKFKQDSKEKELVCLTNELESLENPNQDHLSCSSSVGDLFWQNKSPVHNNQFWSQNLQDLGMCQEIGCSDDFNIPDVDVTFRNFEDLLTGDDDLTRALLEDNDPMFEDLENILLNKFEKSLLETTQVFAASSSISSNKHVNFMKESYLLNHDTYGHGPTKNMEHSPHLKRFSLSATFAGSRLSAESNGSDFVDSGNSDYVVRGESSNDVLAELHGEKMEDQENPNKSKDVKKTRLHGKRTQLAPRKAKADMHKRIKSRCAKLQGYESDPANVTKSY